MLTEENLVSRKERFICVEENGRVPPMSQSGSVTRRVANIMGVAREQDLRDFCSTKISASEEDLYGRHHFLINLTGKRQVSNPRQQTI